MTGPNAPLPPWNQGYPPGSGWAQSPPPPPPQWYTAPPPQPPVRSSGRSKVWIGVAAGFAGAVVAMLAVLMFIGTVITSPTLISTDFNDGRGPFSTDSDPSVTLEFVDGGYGMLVKDDSAKISRSSFADGTVTAMRVAIDATIRSATDDFVMGVAAVNGPGLQYILATSSAGGAALLN